MHNMTAEECWQFLAERPRTAILSSVRADGRPHATPIWIDQEGGTIYSTTWHTGVKANNIRRDPRVCLCVNDDMPPYAYVIVEATAELADDREAVVYWATRLGGRYMGAELAETYGKRNGVPGELLVRLTPTRIFGHSNITGSSEIDTTADRIATQWAKDGQTLESMLEALREEREKRES